MTLQVSSSPHIRDQASTTRLMLDVIIALLPALGVSIYMFGLRSLLIVVLTCTTAVLFEYLSRKLMKRYNSIGDLSAVVTGLLLAFNLPPTVPLYVPVIGSFVAVVVVKQMFGGIGQNFVNPALASRIILTLSFPAAMTRWAILAGRIPGHGIPGTEPIAEGVDLIATATPLYLIQAGETGSAVMPGYLDLFIGYKGGCLGEVSVLALAAGVVYLLIRRVISPLIPVTYILTVALLTALFGQDPLYHMLSGGLFLGAFFMATDYVTSPLSNKGKIIFGLGCGLITSLVRLFGGMTEGVSFAILFMNILTPHIDRWTIPVPFGGVRHAKS
ncbi:MAG: RnfABCDGE type electron transport complex subunit D [Clostridiaceae bacterium]|nr:RnfABCDGE type electron transport complex subunit D [Clostridiales bacterium]MDD2441015.1 RnfABCDGE type electron transport complex subunit D [Eubacteriales bacterium]MDD4139956.1 RnfABCDGE type electron transport complex subunit D [Eubacteriales bacterium]MDD4744419.1 RnfABCDGE type electron transport complex subunit D [Eubacteriales bacterium]NLB43764.1 RnfABCDGE type electron transport complex subunit D [Clostridiaceae bacterium]